jgi:hypothetical protein
LVKHLTNAELYSSDPRSSKYGKHYTSEEVTNLFAPSSATVDVVKSWLVHSGIREERISQSPNKAWLQFDTSVDKMEQLLQVKYYNYEHINSGRKYTGCEDYKLPAALSDHVDYVTPGAKFLPTTAMGDIKKRNLASRASQLPKRQSMSCRCACQNQTEPRRVVLALKLLVFFANVVVRIDATDNCGCTVAPACIRLCTTSQLARFRIQEAHWASSSGVLILIISRTWICFSKLSLRKTILRFDFFLFLGLLTLSSQQYPHCYWSRGGP